MRKLLFAFCALMFSAAASAQIETKIVGVWSVDSVTENKDLKLNNKETKDYSKLKKSEIIFTADHHAKFKLLFSVFNIADGFNLSYIIPETFVVIISFAVVSTVIVSGGGNKSKPYFGLGLLTTTSPEGKKGSDLPMSSTVIETML